MGKSEASVSREPGEFGGRCMAARTGVWVVLWDAGEGWGGLLGRQRASRRKQLWLPGGQRQVFCIHC